MDMYRYINLILDHHIFYILQHNNHNVHLHLYQLWTYNLDINRYRLHYAIFYLLYMFHINYFLDPNNINMNRDKYHRIFFPSCNIYFLDIFRHINHHYWSILLNKQYIYRLIYNRHNLNYNFNKLHLHLCISFLNIRYLIFWHIFILLIRIHQYRHHM